MNREVEGDRLPIPIKITMGESSEEQMKKMPLWKKRKWASKPSLSVGGTDTWREIAWEKRRTRQEKIRRKGKMGECDSYDHVTDEDLSELRGCIELGFGFNEEDDQKLCATLPALDLYFAVNRQLSISPRSPSSSFSPTSDPADTWRICSPGENPEQVKTRLRHWAQAVACSVMQSS